MESKKTLWGYYEDGFFHFWDEDSGEWDRCTEDSAILGRSERVQFEELPAEMVEDLELKVFDIEKYIWYRVK